MSTVFVTGANRGIGLEFVRQYAQDDWQVIACCRNPDSSDSIVLREIEEASNGKVKVCKMDMLDHRSIESVSDEYSDLPIDVLINNAGIIGPVPIQEHLEAQHFGSIDYGVWETVIKTNTFAPIKVAESFINNIISGKQKKIITISSTVGSFQEDITPAFCYCTSKTAVTKAVQILGSLLKEKEIICMAFCPGHVKTRMGWSGAGVEIEDSVSGMRDIISRLKISDASTFLRYNGEVVAW